MSEPQLASPLLRDRPDRTASRLFLGLLSRNSLGWALTGLFLSLVPLRVANSRVSLQPLGLAHGDSGSHIWARGLGNCMLNLCRK